MNCQKCSSERILSFEGKTSDMFNCSIGKVEHNGYVPKDIGLGGSYGDYVSGELCLDCGQMQGKWPLPKTEFELEAEQCANDPFKVGDYVEFKQNGRLLVGCVKEYDRDNLEVIIDVAGTWIGESRNRIGSIPYHDSRMQKTVKIDQNEVTKTDKEW